MDRHKKLAAQRQRRSFRVRNKIKGNADRPRMCVHRSLTGLSVQLIDDAAGRTADGTALHGAARITACREDQHQDDEQET